MSRPAQITPPPYAGREACAICHGTQRGKTEILATTLRYLGISGSYAHMKCAQPLVQQKYTTGDSSIPLKNG